MGTLLDTSVLIAFERNSATLPLTDNVAISAITLSELLRGLHRADAAHRGPRLAFIENALRIFPVVPFTEAVARIHAELWAQTEAAGKVPGAADLIIAATAVALGWEVATLDRRGFSQIPGLALRYL
ncbi:MAG TPA: PIN domain-containing protein [Candidatus Dormibacteraeota bacterium]|nr:PIN domain-containing protein [Candidatus Dormibacteraeota bacterium]